MGSFFKTYFIQEFLNKKDLGTKFFYSLIFVSIVPLALISVVNYVYTKAELEAKTIGHLRAINDSRAAHINSLIQLKQEQAKTLTGSSTIRQLNPQGSNPYPLPNLIQSELESVYYEIKKSPGSDYKYIDRASTIDNMSVWDIHGNIVADTNRSFIGKKMPFKFLQVLYEKGTYFKGFELDALTGNKYLTVMEGVRNWTTLEYSGVVFLKSNARILNDITTAREGLGETTETYIVDKDRLMITESRFVKDAVLNQEVRTPGVDACFSGKKSPAVYRNYTRRLVLGAQKYLPDQQWCIVTETDVSEALQPVIVYRNRIVFMFSLLIILIVFLVRLIQKAFIVPIVRLRDASLQVASGHYDVDAAVSGNDELGELSRAFSQMTKVLAMTTTQLKEKNKILEEQKEELKKFDQLKSEFVSIVSHELRTPMSIIKGSLSQILDPAAVTPPETREKLLAISLKNVNRLTHLVNNLLDLSKIEAGKIELHKEWVNFTVVAREVCHSFVPQAKEKNIEIRERFSSDSIMANVDKDKMIQVLMNLIGNSMKFVEKGFVQVSVDDVQDVIVCMVQDTGKGIAREDLPKVFGKFKQFGPQDSGTKGTGLGLSISKGLVELHKGKIWVESELGVGTKFIFEIPKNS